MFVYITTIWWSWLPVIKSDMLKSRLGEREHTCVCWWSSDYPWGAGGPFIGSLPHISALSIFFETSQCLHRKRFQFPASDVLGHTPATWIWGIWLKGMEGATVEAVCVCETPSGPCIWYPSRTYKNLSSDLSLGVQPISLASYQLSPLGRYTGISH